jgi:RNA polymerase sigma-70 factor (ECF subfamily)
LASDADPIRGIALTGKIDFFPVRRSDEKDARCMLHDRVSAVTKADDVAELSDEALMELVRNKDAQALDVLFSRHSRLVFSIAMRILKDAGEAEEVVQESFLYVYRKANAYERSRGNAKVWIVQVAYSRARDRKAHLARRGFYLRADIESSSLDKTLAAQEDVEREIGARLDLDRLQGAFEDLTDTQRRTLELFYFEDLDLREISERLREPLGNVRHHFYRGLERLRKSALAERLRDQANENN